MLKRFKVITSLRTSLIVGVLLFIFGLVGLIMLWTSSQHSQQVFAAPEQQVSQPQISAVTQEANLQGVPVRIQVPSVKVDLPVAKGYYHSSSQKWTLTTDKAHWGIMTAPANDTAGMTFIYAHYRKGVFLNLPKIKAGEQVIITTDNGHTFTYEFKSKRTTDPTDTSLFNYSGKPILVLQTCSGILYQDRQLFTFELTEAK